MGDDARQRGLASAEMFQAHRARLWRIAYGIVATPEDADDLVQEAYIRWHRTRHDEVRQPEAWLVTTITRLGIDRLRALQTQRKLYEGPWLPAPVFETASDTSRAAEVGSELTLAFMALLERLAPEERAAYLLREVFDAEYGEIARVLDRSESACRQVVHRARARVRGGPRRFAASAREVEDLAARFSQAVEADDYESLITLLTPDARYITDGGGEVWAALRPVQGSGRVARCILGVARKRLSMGESVEERIGRINGEPGLLSYADGEIIAATAFEVEAGRISGILRVLNPGKLRNLVA